MKTGGYILLTVLIILLPCTTYGQNRFRDDTLVIDEVIIKSAVVSGVAGYRQTYISSEKLQELSSGSLSQLLERYTSLVIKNYGSGGLSTASFRGLGSNHTSVIWEGIKVNNVMSGQSDLSIIPVSFAGKVMVFHGAAGGDVTEAGPGGAILLASVPEWKNGIQLGLEYATGSFGFNSGRVNMVTGNNRFQYSIRAYKEMAGNDFRYIDKYNYPEPVALIRENSDYSGYGLLQEVYTKWGDNIFSAKMWYNFTERNLPGPIVAYSDGSENQTNESFMTILTLKNYTEPVNLQFKLAWLSDWLHYSNGIADIDSRNKSDNIVLTAGLKKQISEALKVELTLSDYLDNVNSVNYSEIQRRNRLYLDLVISGSCIGRVGYIFMVRERVADNNVFLPEPSIGIDYKLHETKNYKIKGNVGRSLHLPALNDLYWSPGGNDALKNENGINGEISLSMEELLTKNIYLSSEITCYYSRISNMIKWLPGELNYWEPVNISDVVSRGIETELDLDINLINHRISVSALYSYTSAVNRAKLSDNDQSTGKQLIYVPEHQGRLTGIYSYRHFVLNWNNRLTGKRYVTTDNSDSLPGYFVTDLSAGIKLKISSYESVLNLKVDNIFGADYENIAYYPMPGRSFTINLKLKLTNR
ncbi:MAG TPA: TonB-dependent receptor [Bacteroidales bacterium]|nr:TonB-dependent receptor [Bacteroidales bacterium]